MKIYLDRFVANNPKLNFEDVIQNIKAGVTKKGTINLHFETRDKYIEVDALATVWSPDYKGKVVKLHPFLYREGNDDLSYCIDMIDDEYYEHPDYWSASLIVDTGDEGGYTSSIIALKHEYFVSFIQDSEVMNYDCLNDVELIEFED